MEIVIATNNQGKLHEIRSMLPGYTILTLRDIEFTDAIPEPFDTFAENAWNKAQTVFQHCGKPVMADDSGLCVDALNGDPGVFSARYAGEGATDEANVQKLLQALDGVEDRRAHYAAVICLYLESGPQYFDGSCHGRIAETPAGNQGFGYDPVFVPEGYLETFAQLPLPVKNKLSHRGEAVGKLVHFLTDLS